MPTVNEGDDAKERLAVHRGALKMDKNTIEASRKCQIKQRAYFAKGGA